MPFAIIPRPFTRQDGTLVAIPVLSHPTLSAPVAWGNATVDYDKVNPDGTVTTITAQVPTQDELEAIYDSGPEWAYYIEAPEDHTAPWES
jgi:hypothetical protein